MVKCGEIRGASLVDAADEQRFVGLYPEVRDKGPSGAQKEKRCACQREKRAFRSEGGSDGVLRFLYCTNIGASPKESQIEMKLFGVDCVLMMLADFGTMIATLGPVLGMPRVDAGPGSEMGSMKSESWTLKYFETF